MALSDLISRPLTAPLEGFDKAVGVGFELAQKQDQLRIAREQLDVRQEEIKSEYLSKGMNALSVISKTKNASQRKALYQTFIGYMEKGGMPFNPDTVKALLSSEETIVPWAEALQRGKNKYPDDPVLAWAEAAEIANKDPDRAVEDTLKLRQAQLAGGSKQTLEEYKASVEQRKAAAIRKQTVLKTPTPAPIIQRGVDLYPNDPDKQAQYYELYQSAVGNRLNSLRAGIRAGLPEAKKNPEKFKELNRLLNEAESSYIPDTDKSVAALQQAEQIFGELKGAYKPVQPKQEKPRDVAKSLNDLRKEVNALLKSDIETIAAADKIIKLADRPGPLSAGILIGQMQQLRENKPSVLREGEYKVALDNQNFDERISNFLTKYGSIGGRQREILGSEIRKEYKEISNILKQGIFAGISAKAQPIINSGLAMGATEDQIKKQVFSSNLHQYLFPENKSKTQENNKPFYPTPTGEAPAAPTSGGKKRWSLKAYRQKNPSLTEDQYKRAKEMAIQSGREVVE